MEDTKKRTWTYEVAQLAGALQDQVKYARGAIALMLLAPILNTTKTRECKIIRRPLKLSRSLSTRHCVSATQRTIVRQVLAFGTSRRPLGHDWLSFFTDFTDIKRLTLVR